MDELIGHYVNYRKQSSPSFEELLPVEDFGLYAVCTRHPENLEKEVALQRMKEGVYDLRWGSRPVRLIILSEILPLERNALWLLFSGIMEKVQYGVSRYRARQLELRAVLNKLVASYKIEGIAMSYTIEDFKREVREEFLASLTLEERLEGLPTEERLKGLPPEERLKGLPPEERLKGLPPEERLKGLPPEERLKGLPPEGRLKGLPPEERLKGLPPEELLKNLSRKQIEVYLKKLSAQNRGRKRKI